MSERFIGEIRIFTGNFAPSGWAMCLGQLLPIAQNTALFSLLGTNYGGDGKSTFGLPNLQQRMPLHPGAAPGLTPRYLGEQGGDATVTLTEQQMPAHNHVMNASSAAATVQSPANALLAKPVTLNAPYHDVGAMAPSAPGMLGAAGGGAAHNNQQPYLALNFIIALNGIYPPRS